MEAARLELNGVDPWRLLIPVAMGTDCEEVVSMSLEFEGSEDDWESNEAADEDSMRGDEDDREEDPSSEEESAAREDAID